MTLFRDMPIRRKLTAMILITSGVVLLLTCSAFVGYELVTFRRVSVRQLATLAEIIAAESTGAVAFDNQRDATEILSALHAEGQIVAACLYDMKGRIFARHPATAPDSAFPNGPQADGFRFVDGHLVGFTPVVQVQGTERFGTLYLRSNLEAVNERLRLYGGIAFAVVLLASFVAFGLSQTFQRQLSQPILALADTARAVSHRRDYSVRARKHGSDELGELTDAFNHMLKQVQEQNESLEKRVRERTVELESANDELEAFCSSAAHDLRTPLRTITGFADVLLDSRTQLSSPEAQRTIRLIRDGSVQMSALIDDLLAFSRHGRKELSRQTVDLDQLCREVFADLGAERGNRKVELTVQPLPSANGDAALLRLVFVNLLSNALKYSRPRDVAMIEVGVVPDAIEGIPVYFVRDNGVGFDMRDATKLFGVFQRLHHSHEFEGTGVGLATVRRIVDRHGGRIWAESRPNLGATFYFTLSTPASAV
ncbi:MAG: ATP-binding protein [Opitutaceae bacterium]